MFDYDFITQKIGYVFNNVELLKTAFTHSSYANEHGTESYERLEFLGDSIVDFIIGYEVYTRFKKLAEGKLTVIRANIVSGNSLAEHFSPTGLIDCVRFGKKSFPTNKASMTKLYANLFESILGAIFIDSGENLDAAREFVLRFLGEALDKTSSHKDAKSMLVSYCQKRNLEYSFLAEKVEGTPIDEPLFIVKVIVNGVVKGEGSARTKKEASQIASQKALNGFLSID